jgi:hypothetical protein
MRILHILDQSLPLQSGYVYRTLGIAHRRPTRSAGNASSTGEWA